MTNRETKVRVDSEGKTNMSTYIILLILCYQFGSLFFFWGEFVFQKNCGKPVLICMIVFNCLCSSPHCYFFSPCPQMSAIILVSTMLS